MNTTPLCPSCGKPLAPNAPKGLCAECLLKAGFPTGTQTEGGDSKFVPPSTQELSTHFPQLEIIELIGRGGMGAVYKARQKQLDRIVALKILPPGIGDQGGFAERFAREAKALARLNHPGIVTLYEFGQANELFFFLMEFVDGVNLRQLLHGGRIASREALAIVPQICDALQYAHDQGIVHRDIKPENILMDRRGRVKVADFGLARLMGVEAESLASGNSFGASVTLTEAGKIMGTPQYMAPEQKERPTDVDHRADIYALGVVFYQMLTGELPDKRLEPPSKKVQVDVRLDEIVLRALEREPNLRYQQASVLKTEVESMTSDADETAGVEAPSSPLKESRIKTWLRRSWVTKTLWTLFALCLLNFLWVHRTYLGNQQAPTITIGATTPWFASFPVVFAPEASGANGIKEGRTMTVNPTAGSFQSGAVALLILVVILWSKQKSSAPVSLRRRIAFPSWALIVIALFLLWETAFNLRLRKFVGDGASGEQLKAAWLFACLLVGRLAASGLILYSAIEMRYFRRYSWALLGPVIMLVTAVRLQGIWWIGVPFAAWALEVLLREEVRKGFIEKGAADSKQKPVPAAAIRGALAIAFAGTSGMLGLLTFAASPNPPVWLLLSIPLSALVGIVIALPVRRTVSGGTALIVGAINLAIWLVIGAVFTAIETGMPKPATTGHKESISPQELKKFSTAKVIQAGIDDPTSGWPWQELEVRAHHDQLSKDETAVLMQKLTEWLQTFPNGYDKPLFWMDSMLTRLQEKGLITDEQAIQFLVAFCGHPKFHPLPRLREGEKTLNFTCRWRSSWNDKLFGMAIFNELKEITVDGTPELLRNLQGQGRSSATVFGDVLLPALSPGTHKIRAVIDTAIISEADSVGLGYDVSAKEWPPAKRRWTRIVESEFSVFENGAQLATLISDPKVNPIRALSVSQIIIRTKDKKTKALIVFKLDTEKLSVPMSFDVALDIAGRQEGKGHLWTEKPGKDSFSMSGLEQTLDIPPMDSAVRSVDVVLTPNPDYVDHVASITEIWGEKIRFSNVPITRQDLH